MRRVALGQPVHHVPRDSAVVRRPVDRVSGPDSGSHNVSLDVRAERRELVAAALRQGSWISNGFASFWNQESPEENACEPHHEYRRYRRVHGSPRQQHDSGDSCSSHLESIPLSASPSAFRSTA